ncbi:MAG: hypothetical protein PHZ26_03670 [Candidatus Gracilibacteria bacterium]|nr:hypothetical protein [Candidatus Gracilibacteria bacterium]MDD2908826.1 hypothetical protein [Candidatus Gracilibacteria bacterium]
MKKNIFSGVVLLLFFVVILLISGIIGGLQFIVSICSYGLIFYIFHILWSKITKKPIKNYKDFALYFINRISILLVSFISLFGSFIYYENYLEPALLPEFTLSNGQKTVVFQGMAHIGSENFYTKIKNNIIENKKAGFVLFYEGVKLGKKENMDKFDRLIGFEFNKKTYSNLSKMYGLSAQNNQDFLNLVNSKDYNTDVSMDTIIAKYEKKHGTITKDKVYNKISQTPLKMDDIINQTVNLMTPKELEVLIQVNRAIMNFIIKNENVRDMLLESSGQGNLFDIILDDRNAIIVDAINTSKENKIHILYGLMHFNGVWKALQEGDSNWKVVNIRYFKPID